MVDYTNTFVQFGAELKNMRKTEALFEHHKRNDGATYSKRLVMAAYSDSLNDEALAELIATSSLDAAAESLRGVHDAQLLEFERGFFGVLDAELAPPVSDRAAGAIQYIYDAALLANGQVSIAERRGYFGALRRAMIADSQSIRKNGVTFGSFTAATANKGVLVVGGSPTFAGSDHTLSGTIIWEVEDETVDNPRLRVSLLLNYELIDRGILLIRGDQLAQVGKSYEDGPTGLTFGLNLDAIVKTNDAGAAILTVPVITKPSEADTNKGIVYIKITRQSVEPLWLIEWYNDADTADPANLVQRATATGVAGTTAITMTGSLTTLTFTFSNANANTDMPAATNTRTITLDIKTPRIGDRWTRTVTNDETGLFATKIAKRYRVSLNSVANPGQTITDTGASSESMS